MLDVAARAQGGKVLLVSSLDAEHPPENMIDGTEHTYWLSTGLYPQEILLQLGRAARISVVRLSSTAVHEVRIEVCQEDKPVNFHTLAEGALQDVDGQLQLESLACGEQKRAVAFVRIVVLSGWRDFCSVHRISVEADPGNVEEAPRASSPEPEEVVRDAASGGQAAIQISPSHAVAKRHPEQAQWLEHVSRDGLAIRFAGALSSDREVVLAAVRQTGDALQFVSPEMQGDREVAIAAVQQKGRAVQWASVALQADHQVAVAAVQQNGNALQFLAMNLRRNRDVVLAAVGQHGSALRWAGRDLLSDSSIVDEAARTYYWSKTQLAELALEDGAAEEKDSDSDAEGR